MTQWTKHNFMTINNKTTKIAAYFLVAITIFSTITSTNRVLAINDFYSQNDILFYDPSDSTNAGCPNTGDTALTGNDNLEKILRYYTNKGLTLAQASGIAGNYQQESTFNPAITQDGSIVDDAHPPVSGVGFGLAQWTFTERQQPLTTFAKSTNRSITDLAMQLDFTWVELNGTHKTALASLRAATTVDDATFVFHRDYETSADTITMIQTRINNANNIYSQYNGKIISGGSSGCSGQASQYIDGFAVYNQNDPQWNTAPYGTTTIGAAGCGPSALAMIITNLTGSQITPIDTATYGAKNGTYVSGAGSSWSITSILSEHWGLKATHITADAAKINEVLRAGGLISTSGTGAAPFTSSGHFITIRAVTAGGKWLIGDSNGNIGAENSKKEWDPSTILMTMSPDNVWAVTK